MALSDAFGGSAKAGDAKVKDPFAMLAPPPAPAPPSQVAPVPSAPAPAAEPAMPAMVPAPAGEPAVRERTPVRKPPRPVKITEDLEDLAEATSQVQVYLRPWAIKAARRLASAEGLTNAQIAYDAIDRASSGLGALVRARQVDQRPAGSAFPGQSVRRRPRRGRSEQGGARTLWSLQATPKERAVLDRLVVDTEADSISQLVSAALEAYLAEDAI